MGRLKQNNIPIPEMNLLILENNESAETMHESSRSPKFKNKSNFNDASPLLKSDLQEHIRNLEKDNNDLNEQLQEKDEIIEKQKQMQHQYEMQSEEMLKKDDTYRTSTQQMKSTLDEKITLNFFLEKKMKR